MKKALLILFAALAILSLTVAPAVAATTLFGETTTTYTTDDDLNPEGTAEAFQFTAVASGTAAQVCVWIGANSQLNLVQNLKVGVYTDSSDTPNSLISGSTATLSPVSLTWQCGSVNFSVSNNTKYWIAILPPNDDPATNGYIFFRDHYSGGASDPVTAYVSSATNLTSLPSTYSAGTGYKNDASHNMAAYVQTS